MSAPILHFASPASPHDPTAVERLATPSEVLTALRLSLAAIARSLDEMASAVGAFLDAAPETSDTAATAEHAADVPLPSLPESGDLSIAAIIARNEESARDALAEDTTALAADAEPARNQFGETATEALERALNDDGAHAIAVAEAQALTSVTPRDADDVLPLLRKLGFAIGATPRADFGATLRGRWAPPDATEGAYADLLRRAFRLASVAAALNVPWQTIAAALGFAEERTLQQTVMQYGAEVGPVDLDPEFRRLAGVDQ